ncbi:DUF5677 domain-containing protein [Vibrio sp. TRT 21S02]|uniref:DUF5677 domain-containing protein n=1 Tax=Vibrio sp. TRT 21S02 TaxID=3418507 RepID=UPI003CE70CC7
MTQKRTELRELLLTSESRIKSLSQTLESDKDRAMLALWNKLIKNSLAILMLVDGDLKDEAISIQRLALEHLFNLFALARNDSFYDEFINGSQFSVVKGMKALHSSIEKRDEDSLTPEGRSDLEAAMKQAEDNPIISLGYSIYNAANKSELGPLYDSLYRAWSVSYAHSTAISILREVSDTEDEILNETCGFLKFAYSLSSEVWGE